jgi:hypothetical protein
MGVKRQILGFPYVAYPHTPATGDEEKMSVGLRICLLPGLIDLPKLKDSFTSSTLVLEMHREDVFARAFHQRNVEEYASMANAEKAKHEPAADASAGKKGGKAAPPPAAKKGAAPAPDANVVSKAETTEMTAMDRFLLSCIQRALAASRQIRPHGTIRYRLEQLLSSSNDLLTRFARMRHGGQPVSGDETVVVKVWYAVWSCLVFSSLRTMCDIARSGLYINRLRPPVPHERDPNLLLLVAGGPIDRSAPGEALQTRKVGPPGRYFAQIRPAARQRGGPEPVRRHPRRHRQVA